MGIPLYQVEAFAGKPVRGSPASPAGVAGPCRRDSVAGPPSPTDELGIVGR
jgi:hypothetical protein